MLHNTILSSLSLALVLGLTGCYRNGLAHDVRSMPQRAPEVERWNHQFVHGLVPSRDTDVQAACPDGVDYERTLVNGWQGLLGALTLGIYTPSKVNLWCRRAEAPHTGQAGSTASAHP